MAEVFQALRDVSLQVEERLKVACDVARNGNPDLLEGKTAFLAKWACEEICNKKNRSPPTAKVCSQLWQFLATMLESQQRNRKQRSSKLHSTKRESPMPEAPITIHLVQAMRDVLGSHNTECMKSVLRCVVLGLRCQPLPSVLYKFEVVVSLLLSVLALAGSADGESERVKEGERGEEVKRVASEEEGLGEEEGQEGGEKDPSLLETALSLMLDHFTYLQGTQGNQKKVFTTVCSQLLSSVIILRYSPLVIEGSVSLGDKLDAVLCSLFSKDHLTEYTSALSHHAAVPTGRRSAVSYTKLLFECLQKMLNVQDSRAPQAALHVIPSLFEAFLQQNGEVKKLSKGIEFQFFLKLLFLLGFPVLLTTADNRITTEEENSKSKVVGKKESRPAKKRVRIEVNENKVNDDEDMEEEEEEKEHLSISVGGREMSISDHEREEEDDGEADKVSEEEKEREEEGDEEGDMDWEMQVARIIGENSAERPVEVDRREEEEEDGRRFSEPVLSILATCLHLLHMYNVYQVNQDQSSGNKQFGCLRSLCVDVVKNTTSHNLTAMARCLEEALHLNHKIVEPLLASLLLLATTTSDLRERMESFVQKCVTIYSKLHQLSVLVGKLFSALEKMAMSPSLPTTLSPYFSKSSEYWFCRHVQDLPPGQSVALLEQLTQSLQSVFLARLPILGVTHADMMETQRRKRRRLSKRKNGAFALCEISTCFSAALMRGVDIFSLVLLNTPVSLWSGEGMHRERAMAALLEIQRDVCVPLMKSAKAVPALSTAALSVAHSVQSLLFCIRDTMPATTSAGSSSDSACQDIAHSLFAGSEMSLVWSDEWSLPIPELWMEAVREGEGEGRVFTAASNYFLKAMAVVQLRFEKNHHSHKDTAHLLDFVFEEIGSSKVTSQDTTWSGQPLDVNDGNFPTAVGDSALSSLPLFYCDCLPTHLQNIASFLYSSLLHGPTSMNEGGRVCIGERGGGRTGWEIALGFLHSEAFQDMRQLQELLLATCFERTALALPKSLKEIKPTLLSCSGQLLDSSAHLTEAIEQGIQLLGDRESEDIKSAKRRKSILKSVQHLSVCLEVMKVTPMAFTHPELLHRCVLVLTISHIGLVHSLGTSCPSWEPESRSQLSELQLVLAWTLLSLVHRPDKVGKKMPRLCPLPFPQLLMWTYTAAQYCIDLVEDENLQFQTSCLVLFEAELESAFKCGSYPSSFVQHVVGDVSKAVTGVEETSAESLALFVFQLTVTKICKAYSELKPGQREGSVLHEPVMQLLQETTQPLSHMRKKSPERIQFYPLLASAFSLLLRTNPPSNTANLSKSLKVAGFFSDTFCSDEALHSAVSKPSILFSVIDCLSLAASLNGNTQTNEHFTVTESWSKLVTLLKAFLEQDLDKSGGYLVGLCGSGLDGSSSTGSWSSADRVMPQLGGVMTRLLVAADREQTTSMFQLLHKESCDSVATAMAVCYSWSIILNARLQPESQRELRKWHIKILLQCESLAIQHKGVAPVVIMSLNITTRLVALPTRVGLDSRLVLISLHQTAVIKDTPVIKSQMCLVLQSVGQLLFTVLKNHSSVAASCPGPVVTAVNKLVKVVLEHYAEGTGGEGEKAEMEGGASAANLISRIFDHLAGHQEFARYVSCIMSSYVAATVQHRPAKPVNTSLLPGVYSLLRQCSEEDSAFIQASLDSTARTHFQSLLEDFRKRRRFL